MSLILNLCITLESREQGDLFAHYVNIIAKENVQKEIIKC